MHTRTLTPVVSCNTTPRSINRVNISNFFQWVATSSNCIANLRCDVINKLLQNILNTTLKMAHLTQ
jgi:hypothetical protein